MSDDAAPTDDSAAPDDGDSGERASEPIPPHPDALDADELRYPEFAFPEGSVTRDGGFDVARELDHDAMAAWLRDLAGALDSHDLAVAGADRRATLGVSPDAAEMSFDPDEDHRGTFEVTVRFEAKLMDCVDADAPTVGARGGAGFIPVEMLTGDRDPGEFRCYNWIDDPTADE